MELLLGPPAQNWMQVRLMLLEGVFTISQGHFEPSHISVPLARESIAGRDGNLFRTELLDMARLLGATSLTSRETTNEWILTLTFSKPPQWRGTPAPDSN